MASAPFSNCSAILLACACLSSANPAFASLRHCNRASSAPTARRNSSAPDSETGARPSNSRNQLFHRSNFLVALPLLHLRFNQMEIRDPGDELRILPIAPAQFPRDVKPEIKIVGWKIGQRSSGFQ